MAKIAVSGRNSSLDAAIRAVEKSGEPFKRLGIAGCTGLYLVLKRTASGGYSKRWIVRARVNGQSFDRSLNGLTYEVQDRNDEKPKTYCGLPEVRDIAREYLARLGAGIDPLEEKKKEAEAKRKAKAEAKAQEVTFKQAAIAYVAMRANGWAANNPRRERRTMDALEARAFPTFGDKPVGEVNADDVFEALTRDDWLFEVKESTSRKVRDYINGVCDWAIGQGLRPEGMLPASLAKGSKLAALFAQIKHRLRKDGHNATIDYRDAPTFFRELCALPPSNGRNALIFGMLTALRGDSYRELCWSAVNWDEPSCRIPETHRKKKGAGFYEAYLSPYAVAFLKALPRWQGDCVFSANDGRDAITQPSLKRAIEAMNKRRRERGLQEWRDWSMPDEDGVSPVVKPHAICRTTFTTWSEDDEHGVDAAISKLAVELCLDHDAGKAKGDPLKGSYRRNPKKKSRVDALTLWGRFLITGRYPDEPDGAECEEWKNILKNRF